MKIGKILTISAAAFAAFAALPLCAQNKAPARELQLGDMVKQGDKIYYLVRIFSTPEQNAAFQRDIDIMRRHASAIDKCKTRLEELAELAKSADEKKRPQIDTEKARIEKIRDTLTKDFSANEEAMKKLYGFVANRDYRITYDESNVCVPLTKEELSELKTADGEKLDPLKIITRGDTSVYILKNISGTRENEQLQRMLGFSITRKMEIDKLRDELSQTVDPQEQLKISAAISSAEKAMQENESNLRAKYGIQKERNYAVEVVKSKMFLIISPEEAQEIAAQSKKK